MDPAAAATGKSPVPAALRARMARSRARARAPAACRVPCPLRTARGRRMRCSRPRGIRFRPRPSSLGRSPWSQAWPPRLPPAVAPAGSAWPGTAPRAAHRSGRKGAFELLQAVVFPGSGSPAGCLKGEPRQRLAGWLHRAWQRSHAMHDSPLPPFLATWAFPFRLRKRPPEIVHSARSLPRRSSVRRRIDADANLPGSCGEPLERLASL